MRTILVLAGLLAATAAPVTAGAQHGATPAPAAHAADTAKPAPKAEVASTHGAKAAEAAKPAEKAAEKPGTKPGTKPVEKAAAAGHETAATHDTKPAEKPEKSTATARKAAPRTDLEAAFDRIAQKIDGAEMMKGGLRISSPGGPGRVADSHAGDAHTAEPRAARADATPRIRLNWRSSVVWPASLGQGDTHDAATPHDTTRITLAWE